MDQENNVSATIESWELDLIHKVALAFRTDDREELTAELARKLAVLKGQHLGGIRDWKAYLAKFLYNKASNWVRDDRARRQRTESFETSDGNKGVDGAPAPAREDPDDALRMTMRDLWSRLDPELRRFWQILVEEDGNQVAAARRLGKHRNTVRLWVGRIKKLLKVYGLDS